MPDTERISAARGGRPPKDRLIQTRVARDLEARLKQEARRRSLTVSHLIRSVLEDAFQLVDGVVAEVDEIVGDSVDLARSVRRNAQRLVSPDRSSGSPPSSSGSDLSHVYAWNELVLQRSVVCSGCGAEVPRGARGFVGLSDQPRAPRVWHCQSCVEAL